MDGAGARDPSAELLTLHGRTKNGQWSGGRDLLRGARSQARFKLPE